MKDNKSDRYNLAIIGASGTGKTTLAVGLYATSTEAFTVSPVGDETRKYLEIRKTSIEEGFWPAATNESENFDLRLRLHASGSQTDIVFREYMGERMERDPNYIREVIGTPKSAMILFNPGMPGLLKPEARNRMLGNLKVIAQHLKDNGCVAVAFVVTASDRLTSDLSAFREDFETYASEVTNHLTNLGLEWKRFEVTVSGQLDDQNKPKLARGENNTTHEPFLWLLKRIRDCKRRKRILAAASVAATILGVSGVLLGGFVFHSRKVLTQAEAAFAANTSDIKKAYDTDNEADVRTTLEFFKTNGIEKVSSLFPSDRIRKQKLVDCAKEQIDLWSVGLLWMEFNSTKNKNKLDVQLGWFADFNSRLTASSPTFRDAINERDRLTNEWAKSRIVLETDCQTAHFQNEIDKERKNLISATKPDALREQLQNSKGLIAGKTQYALVANHAELCKDRGLMTARTNAIASYVDSKISKPEDANPPGDARALCQQISKDLKQVLTDEEFDDLNSIVGERHSAARTAWESYQFPIHCQARLAELKTASPSPSVAFKNSLTFLEDMDNQFPSVSEVDRSKAKLAITNERSAAIARYLDAKTPWKPEDERPPVDMGGLLEQVRLELISAVTDEELSSLSTELTSRRDRAQIDWESYHFPRMITGLETALKGTVANLYQPLKRSLDFLETLDTKFPSIPEASRTNAKESIREERTAAIDRYLDAKAKWNPEDKSMPAGVEGIIDQVRQELIAALKEEEFKYLSEKLTERHHLAQQAWESYHFPKTVKELETLLKGAGASPQHSLSCSLQFLESVDKWFSTISEDRRSVAKESIMHERAALIGRYFDLNTKWKPEDEEPPIDTEQLQHQMRQELMSALTDAESTALWRKLEERRTAARKAWDAYHFPRRVSELETALKSADVNPMRPLKDSLAFLSTMTNNYPTIPTDRFVSARYSIGVARQKILESYANTIARTWDINGNRPPEFDIEKIRDTILTQNAVTEKEYQAFNSDMNDRFGRAKQDWRAKQKKLVDDFSVEGNPAKMVRAYGVFCYEHSRNPFLSELTTKVDRSLQQYFRGYIADYLRDDMEKRQLRFKEFRDVCAAIGGRGLEGNSILQQPSGKFAMLCNNRGKLNDTDRGMYSVLEQVIRITRIEAKMNVRECSDNYKGLDMSIDILNCRWNFEQKEFEVVTSTSIIGMMRSQYTIPRSPNDTWRTIWAGSPEEMAFGPYTTPIVRVRYEDRLDGVFSVDVGDSKVYSLNIFSKACSACDLPDTTVHLYHDWYDNTDGVLQLRVTGLRIGDNYNDLAKEAGLIR